MNACAWIMEDESECGERCEGKMPFCASHSRQLRREAETSRKQSEKRAAALERQKEKQKQPRQKINKVSDKRLHENVEYLCLRAQFIEFNPNCKAQINGYCTGKTEDVHHKSGRVGKNFLDTTTFFPVCRSCHSYIEAHPKEAIEKGWSESRLAKPKETI